MLKRISTIWLLLLAALSGGVAEGANQFYRKMGNDRILLMNNDSKSFAAVTTQSYYDTNKTATTYWVHTGGRNISATALLAGTNHVMWASNGTADTEDDTRLWELVQCRAGSGTVVSNASRCYLPWNTTAKSISDGSTTKIAETSANGKLIGSVIMRNTKQSCIYSPYYSEGIGTIYFDTVNAHLNNTVTPVIKLQMATTTVDGEALSSISNNYDNCQWVDVPFNLYVVRGAQPLASTLVDRANCTVTLEQENATEITLASPVRGPSYFYRVRACVNCYEPARFRIVRLTETGGNLDTAGLVLVDSIVCSYPPCSAFIHQYGEEYDSRLTGKRVLGRRNDFTEPFLYAGETNVFPHAYYTVYSNSQATVPILITDPKFIYRWTYLNQVTSDWQTITLTEDQATRTLTTKTPLDLSRGVGDLEYYYTTEVDGSFYKPQNYTFTKILENGAFGYKDDGKTIWSEADEYSELRGSYKVATPTGNTDFFSRIREGASLWERVQLMTRETVGTNSVVSNLVMELTGAHTWRCYYPMPTNRTGEVIKFWFRGVNKQESGATAVLKNETDWMLTIDSLPYLPYNGRATEDGAYAGAITLEDSATHLLFEFNDEELTYSVSRAAYQDFNLWTDAVAGFVGYYQNETYVSDRKQTWTETFFDWTLSTGTNTWWDEGFNLYSNTVAYPTDVEYSGPSINKGWTVEKGLFVSESYTNKWEQRTDSDGTSYTYAYGLALELEGRGRGMMSLDNLAASDVPPGIDTVSFDARVAQFLNFDDFCYALDHTTDTSYAFSAKAMMSLKKDGTDMSPAVPQISLVAHYRPGKGCYELRMRRTQVGCVEVTLWKWYPNGNAMAAQQLPISTGANMFYKTLRYDTGNNVNNVQTTWYFTPQKDDDYVNWQNVVLCCYDNSDGSVRVHARISGTGNSSDIAADRSSRYLFVDYTDSDNPYTKGSFGVGSANCVACFGKLQQHEMTSQTNFNYTGTSLRLELQEGDWQTGPGNSRMTPFDYSNADPESAQWMYGFKATAPTQTVELLLKEYGQSGTSWVSYGTTNVTSFSNQSIVFKPGVTADSLVQIKVGGTDDEPRTDVVVDNLAVASWRGDDYPNLSHDYGERTAFVYTQVWIEDMIGVPANSYDIMSVGDEEYVYVFKNAGVYRFTPSVDIEVSRVLVVGGGGAGGWTIAAGGGGGSVTEVSNVVFEAGKPVTITVGAGGTNYYVNSNSSAYWRRGGSGGNSSLFYAGGSTVLAYGGGGGGCWNDNSDNERNGLPGGSGGGSANSSGYRARGIAGGNGGRANGEAPGGGGGAGGAGGDGVATDSGANNGQAGAGGPGLPSDITGEEVWYGGGGGGGGGNSVRGSTGSAGSGAGGKGGGGKGSDYNSKIPAEAGTDGLGGGGGGGSHSQANCGGRGGSGTVILRLRIASKLCTLQPRRALPSKPCGVRSPYLENGLGMFTFSYAFANSNAVLLLQVATNTAIAGIRSATTSLSDDDWTTITNFTFADYTEDQLKSGVRTTYLSLHAPEYKGLIRLICDPAVVEKAQTEEDMDYGKITLNKVLCYDEPARDSRSWFGCNLWMNGWAEEQPGARAFLYDSLYGLSCAINWSGKEEDNVPDTVKGIPGFADTELETRYDHDDPYVQSPELAHGVGQVQFRARRFDPDETAPSIVTLYASRDPGIDDLWVAVTNFTVDSVTYQTHIWKTLNNSDGYTAVRLSVKGARNGRYGSQVIDAPAQRVLVDEVAINEAVVPRIAFQNAYPFRSSLQDATKVVANTSADEQPLTGESWGVQVQIVPQQLADEMNNETVRVFLHYYAGGVRKWGYSAWKDDPAAVLRAELECVDRTNLIFRSTYNYPRGIVPPTDKGGTVVQYWLTCEFNDAEGVLHTQAIDVKDWTNPAWYWPIDHNKTYGLNYSLFCPYTLLDSVSPKRAWINEVNYYDSLSSGRNTAKDKQFVEIAVPAGADLTGWYLEIANGIKRTFSTLAMFGYDGINAVATRNMTNHYSFLTIESPLTKTAGTFADTDGTWPETIYDASGSRVISGDGSWYEGNAYALQLVRPSGVIEHQITLEGTNYDAGTYYEYSGSCKALVDSLLAADEGSFWIAAGADDGEGSLGVQKSHGEYGIYPNDESLNCWKAGLFFTAGKINAGQEIDPNWFLLPNGTNVWLYASVTGQHIWQVVGGVPITNGTQVVVLPKGHSTNITYHVDNWFQLGGVDIGGSNHVSEAKTIASHTYDFPVKDVEETITVTGTASPDSTLAEKYGLTADNRYTPAVMDWLLTKYPDGGDVKLAEFWSLSGSTNSYLTLTQMYWLDIPPCDGGWIFKAGIGGTESASHRPVIGYTNYTDAAGNACSNVCMTVFMMISNKTTDTSSPLYGKAHPPYTLNGLAPGSTSADSSTYGSNWTSATFKVTGALQNGKVNTKFMPLRWFVFGPDSFRGPGEENPFTADVQVLNPFTKASPAYNYGWYEYRDTGTPIFYMWKLDGEGPGLDTADMLNKEF